MLFGVILGALAAHSLEGHLMPEQIDSFQTGVRYQIIHGLALLILGLWPSAQLQTRRYRLALQLLIVGAMLFSVSIYILNLRELIGLGSITGSILGPVTPLGGLLMIIGWGVLLFHFSQRGVNKEI